MFEVYVLFLIVMRIIEVIVCFIVDGIYCIVW